MKNKDKKKQVSKKKPATEIQTSEPDFLLKLDNNEFKFLATDKSILKKIFGSNDKSYQTMAMHWLKLILPKEYRKNESQLNAALHMLISIGPQNEMEAMLASQMLASHFCGLKSATRTQMEDISADQLSQYANQTTKFMRVFWGSGATEDLMT